MLKFHLKVCWCAPTFDRKSCRRRSATSITSAWLLYDLNQFIQQCFQTMRSKRQESSRTALLWHSMELSKSVWPRQPWLRGPEAVRHILQVQVCKPRWWFVFFDSQDSPRTPRNKQKIGSSTSTFIKFNWLKEGVSLLAREAKGSGVFLLFFHMIETLKICQQTM